MKMVEAMGATLGFAWAQGYQDTGFDEVGVDYEHLESMLDRVTKMPEQFSEGKLGRWLGYMQGVLVANQCGTLEDMKQLNKRFADEKTLWFHQKRGTTYEIVGEARLQCSTHPVKDGDKLTLYRDVNSGEYSVRAPDEFMDGRFTKIVKKGGEE